MLADRNQSEDGVQDAIRFEQRGGWRVAATL